MPATSDQGTSGAVCRRAADTRFAASPRIVSWWITALCVLRSARKPSRSRPCRNSRMLRQAMAMSRSQASSRDIEWLGAREDGAAAEGILAALQRAAADAVDLTAEETLQLALHLHVIEGPPLGVRREGHQQVDVARRTRLAARHRAEERQLADLPAPAEGGDLAAGEELVQEGCHRRS